MISSEGPSGRPYQEDSADIQHQGKGKDEGTAEDPSRNSQIACFIISLPLFLAPSPVFSLITECSPEPDL